MENYTIILLLLTVVIILTAIADRFKISIPIVLILAGICIGFIPNMTPVQINSEIVFLLFLPPLLYDASFKIHFTQFKANLGIISKLAFSLVFVTTIGIAVLAHYLIADLSWPLAFVLGAILAPTDVVAAINITKGMNLKSNTKTILEGESLLNDASALVAFKFALAAVSGAAFVFWEASLSFVMLLVGGFAVGFILAKLLNYVLRYIRHNISAVLSLTLLSPFVAYLVAEHFDVSGVIAVVTLGFSLSKLSNATFPEALKMQSENMWDIISFILNGLIFILIGLEFPFIVKELSQNQLVNYTFISVLITLTALVLRTISVFMHRRKLNKLFSRTPKSGSKKHVSESILLTVKESMIISWSGMRGIISLALAIGLPDTIVTPNNFPVKETIIFITTVVVLFTIIGQGMILPFIVKGKNRSIFKK